MIGKRPILDVIDDLQDEGYLLDLNLHDAGDYLTSCCPFHDEQNPSFAIYLNNNDDKTRWICFGCGKSGDTIDLVREVLSVGYKEALEFACDCKTESEMEARLLAEKYVSPKILLDYTLEKGQKTIRELLKSGKLDDATKLISVILENYTSESINAKYNIKRALNDYR